MRKKLSLELRRELLTRTAEDYASARKRIKSQFVDQLVAATGYGRKHAITLLNNPPSSISSLRPRRTRYDERVKRALVTLWTTANGSAQAAGSLSSRVDRGYGEAWSFVLTR